MEGERIAKSLSVYHEKYKAVVKKNRSAAQVQAADGNITPTATTNLQQQQQQQQQQDGNNVVDDRRRSVELVKKVLRLQLRAYLDYVTRCFCKCTLMQLVPARKTDGKMIPPHLLNDYTSESVRKEQTDLEGPNREMRTISLCPFCQGGEQDNPKGEINIQIHLQAQKSHSNKNVLQLND